LLRLGDIVPADCIVLPGDTVFKVDQSSLTGETIPVSRSAGDDIYGGSTSTLPLPVGFSELLG